MKTFTIEDIRALEPCYDPSGYFPEVWNRDAVWYDSCETARHAKVAQLTEMLEAEYGHD